MHPCNYFLDIHFKIRSNMPTYTFICGCYFHPHSSGQLTWLALGEDQAARSRRVEQLTALWVLWSPRRLRWGRSTAKFLVELARVRAVGNIFYTYTHISKWGCNPERTPCMEIYWPLKCWAEALEKLRLRPCGRIDGNWISFQLANSTPPLSVTDGAHAPSTRMHWIFLLLAVS